jgi:hypothetical protein
VNPIGLAVFMNWLMMLIIHKFIEISDPSRLNQRPKEILFLWCFKELIREKLVENFMGFKWLKVMKGNLVVGFPFLLA